MKLAATARPPSALSGDAQDRLAYLADAAARLWPGSTTVVRRARFGSPNGKFLLLPNARTPRLLVPAEQRRAAATAVRSYGEPSGRRNRVRARVLSAALRTGAAHQLIRDRVEISGGTDGLPGHLADLLGTEVLVSLHLGPPRANRKPVLQLLGRDGRLLGFAKVGIDELTRRLVQTEASALRRLASADLHGLLTPLAVHSGPWNRLEVLVQSPLPIHGRRGRHDDRALDAAMSAVADLDRVGGVPVVNSDFWTALCARVARLPDSPVATQLAGIVADLYDVAGDDALTFGSWHGDWTPWNMAALPTGLAVWDWERFATGVPIGFDALHFTLHSHLAVARRNPTDAVVSLVDGAPARLRSFHIDHRAAAATVLCYLTEIATRYTEDGQAAAGARLGRVQDWLLPALTARVGGLSR